MKYNMKRLSSLILVVISTLYLFLPECRGIESEKVLTLEDLEKMALQNNPTIAQASSGIKAAEGKKIQSGLYPNPIVGYKGEDITARSPGRSGPSARSGLATGSCGGV